MYRLYKGPTFDATATRAATGAQIKNGNTCFDVSDFTAGDFRFNLVPVALKPCDTSIAGQKFDLITKVWIIYTTILVCELMTSRYRESTTMCPMVAVPSLSLASNSLALTDEEISTTGRAPVFSPVVSVCFHSSVQLHSIIYISVSRRACGRRRYDH